MHRATLLGRGYPDPHLDPPRIRFRRALSLSAMSALVPGSAQVAVGRPWIRRVVLAAWFLLAVGLGVIISVFYADQASFVAFFADRQHLQWVQFGLIAAALAWVALLLHAWHLGTNGPLRWPQKLTLIGVNTALIASAAIASAWAVTTIEAPRSAVEKVFTSEAVSEPLKGRYNILLIGADSGDNRTGVRPDSVNIVSIDAASGGVAIISLPRNLQNAQFGEGSPMRDLFPYGFNCGQECLLNAIHTYASERPDLYPDSDDPGMEATIDAVEGTTGLAINYHISVNMQGFRKLVNSVGGLEINVKDRVPIGGGTYPIIGWIEPGLQKLDGREALWFARSRATSDDYSRMGRQKCVMFAMVDQLNPATVLFNAQDIAAAGSDMLATDIPAEELRNFVELGLKARGKSVTTVSFVPPIINPVAPDFDKIHDLVQQAVAKSEGKQSAAPGASATPSDDPTTGLAGASARAREANMTDDLARTC